MDEWSAFPIAPRPYDGTSRRVDPGAGFDWLRQGWSFFVASPGLWIGATALTLSILVALWVVPGIGPLAATLLSPLLGAGLLHLCQRQAGGRTATLADLFAPCQRPAEGLILLGLSFALGGYAIALVIAILVAGGITGGALIGTPAGVGVAFALILGSVLLGSLLALVLATPLLMAMWFAPALVFFNAMAPIEAMKASFAACLRNGLAFLVYGLIVTALSFFAALPLGLGFLVLVPVLTGALFASYRDIFVGL